MATSLQFKLQFKAGLRKTPKDRRDFKFKKVFGVFPIERLPKDFTFSPLLIKDQNGFDFCAAFSTTSVSELQEKKELCPYWQFAKMKQIEDNWHTQGTDLRTACKSLVKFGSLPEKLNPYHSKTEARDFYANWNDWDKNLDNEAISQEKKSYFRVDDSKDVFNDIRQAIWLNKQNNMGVMTGVEWRNEWTDKIKIDALGTPCGGHAIAVIGWKAIDDKPYLIIQNSWGKIYGDNGLYYFSQKVVNKAFNFGAFAFVDMSSEQAKKISWSLPRRIIEKIKKVLKFKIKNLRFKIYE